MAAVALPVEETLLLQAAALAGNEPASSFLEVRSLRADGRPGPREFVPVRERHRVVETVLALRDVHVYLSGAPRVRESGTAQDVERVHCLWGDCDSEPSVEALRAFRPLPSIVVRTSPGRMQALWPLRHAVTPAWARRANRRIARALGSDAAVADSARVLRGIGTFNLKHDPPALVTCARAELDVFKLSEVVGSLLDAPADAARRTMAASGIPQKAGGSLRGLVRSVREATVGERNALLFWAACTAREGGHEAREELREAALDAGLPEHEVERTLDSAERRAAA